MPWIHKIVILPHNILLNIFCQQLSYIITLQVDYNITSTQKVYILSYISIQFGQKVNLVCQKITIYVQKIFILLACLVLNTCTPYIKEPLQTWKRGSKVIVYLYFDKTVKEKLITKKKLQHQIQWQALKGQTKKNNNNKEPTVSANVSSKPFLLSIALTSTAN